MLAALLFCELPSHGEGTVTNYTDASNLLAALAGGGTVTFAADGVITLTNPIVIVTDTIFDAGGHNVVLTGDTNNNPARLISVSGNVLFRISNLKIANGRSTNGGGIYNQGHLILSNCVFFGNSAIGSNGVAGAQGGNQLNNGQPGGAGTSGAAGLGGAIYNAGVAELNQCVFQTNSAAGGSGGNGGNGGNGDFSGGNGGAGGSGGGAFGGAIYNSGTNAMINCTFANNRVAGGNGGAGGAGGSGASAGLNANGGSGAASAGAGLYNLGFATNLNCTFSDNAGTAGNSAAAGTRSNGDGYPGVGGATCRGAGIWNAGTNTLINCTFSGNAVTGGNGGNGGNGDITGGDGGNGGSGIGGGLFNSGRVGVTNCTFANGSAIGGTNGAAGSGAFPGAAGSAGAGLGGNIANLSGAFLLKNSIVGTNLAGGNGYGVITDAGYNLGSDGTLGFSNTGSLNNTNPLLLALANNGGATETMALAANSPAINAGDTNFCLPFDQRMIPRPVGPRCDMGAYEFGANPTLSFITQPASLTVTNGGAATFTVVVMGAAPFTYHWTFNGQDILDAGPTSGSISSYSITSAQAANAGNYRVVVMNFSGSVTSAVATLTVWVAPAFFQQPTSLTVTEGSSATFTAAASGVPPPSFQWFFNGTNLLANATNNSFTISSAQATNQGAYSVTVNNSAGTSNSLSATLTVLPAVTVPVIVTQPQSLTIRTGSAAQFIVVANGEAPLFYQWRFNGDSRSGATSATYALTNVQTSDAGRYDVIVANSHGDVVSAPAFLIVLEPPVVTGPQSLATNVCSPATFSVTVDGSAPFTYRWNFNGADLPGATNATLTVANVEPSNAGSYFVVVRNAVGLAISRTATLSVLAPMVTNLQLVGTTFGFSFATTTGCTYLTESKAGLADLSWTAVATNAGTGGMITNSFSTTTTPSQFYRVRIE